MAHLGKKGPLLAVLIPVSEGLSGAKALVWHTLNYFVWTWARGCKAMCGKTWGKNIYEIGFDSKGRYICKS